ncbi:MAG: tautomerase family protein [Fibrobacteria bacterium]|nr:tautomerase family protein [Fibrobacteria bacterium]
MPHIVVKLYPGRTEDQKQKLTKAIAKNVVEIAGCEDSHVSVVFEETTPEAWPEEVYRPDILEMKKGKLYKKPGYNPFETNE